MYAAICSRLDIIIVGAKNRIINFFHEERGDLISSLGWMAIMALVLVVVKGIIDGKLVSYVNTVFSHLDKVFNP